MTNTANVCPGCGAREGEPHRPKWGSTKATCEAQGADSGEAVTNPSYGEYLARHGGPAAPHALTEQHLKQLETVIRAEGYRILLDTESSAIVLQRIKDGGTDMEKRMRKVLIALRSQIELNTWNHISELLQLIDEGLAQ